VGGHHREVGGHRTGHVALHAGHVLDLVHHNVSVGRVVQLEIHHRRLIFGAGQILQGAQRKKLTAAFAALDNAANAKIVVQDLNRVPDFGVLGLREEVVDDHIIRALKRTALQIAETAG